MIRHKIHILKQNIWKFINKNFGKHCENCGIKKWEVRKYKRICSKCFHAHKRKLLQLENYRKKRKELKNRAHKMIMKMVAKMGGNYRSKNMRRNKIYDWLEKNTEKGHFRDMKTHEEILDAIKQLKKFKKTLK